MLEGLWCSVDLQHSTRPVALLGRHGVLKRKGLVRGHWYKHSKGSVDPGSSSFHCLFDGIR